MSEQDTWPTLLRAKRSEVGITQDKLAAELGVTRNAVVRWEAGDAWPRVEYVGRIATLLGITDAELAAIYRRGPELGETA